MKTIESRLATSPSNTADNDARTSLGGDEAACAKLYTAMVRVGVAVTV